MSDDITGEEFGERVKEKLDHDIAIFAGAPIGDQLIDLRTYIGELEEANKYLRDRYMRAHDVKDRRIRKLPEKVWLAFSDDGSYLEDWAAEPFVADDDSVVTVAHYIRADLAARELDVGTPEGRR